MQSIAPVVSGLFLIQFSDRVQPEWRAQLKTLGVDLLRFVPDDAFIVRVSNADLNRIRALPFVRWVGDYRAQHKLHTALQQNQQAAMLSVAPVNNPVAISILTTPNASRFEVAQLRRALLRIGQESRLRQGTVVRGSIRPSQLATLAQMGAVLWVEPAPNFKLVDEISSKIVGGEDGDFGTPTITQQLGFNGAGVAVAVADTGLNNGDAETMHPDLFGRVNTFLYYGTLTDAADEHSHGTHVAGIIGGNAATGTTDDFGYRFGLGVAPGAEIIVQRIFDGVGNYEAPPSNETMTRDAVRAGAKIGSNSWGDDVQGRYDISAAEFDELVRDADFLTLGDQQYILEFSAGNAGPGSQTMDSPAVGKNVIATGASQNDRADSFIYEEGADAMADFSSRGPAEDGRIKPDLVAPGTWIASLQSESASSDNAWLPIDELYMYQGGTSQSGPHVSGAAAVFVQYYKSLHTNAMPSPALVKAALINSAVDMDDLSGTAPIPNPDEGWGRVDLTQIIGSPRRYEYIDQTTLLVTGQTNDHHVYVSSSSEPLKITMTYTDVPGFPGAIPALVNDLDLEVVGPNGTLYRGNQMEAGESVPNAPSADTINNVEAVHINAPQPGDYLVRIRARNVVEDALVDTPAVDQDFALVISGDIHEPGEGAVLFDRGAYTAPGIIKLQVADSDVAGQSFVGVLLRSASDSKESVVLNASGASGLFTNSIPTVVGSSVQDGQLQIHHGDFIEARYTDISFGTDRIATAIADLVAPVITNVAVTNQFNQMVFMWQTDEPANSIVRFGTNSIVASSVTNSELTTNHVVFVSNVKPGATYQFLVVSSDEAGNTTTNNNGYTFVGAPPATVLLVDAYEPDPDSDEIPVSTYTNALAAAGISFNVWNVVEMTNSPGLLTMKAFPVVIWRISDSIWSPSQNSTLSTAQQSVIQSYVNAGGAFFMSSMEILSRIGDVPFRKNVFQVASFALNPDPFSACSDCDEDVGVPAIQGVGNDPVSSGINVELDYSSYPDFLGLIGPDFSDTFTPTTNCTPVIFNQDPVGKVSGMRFPRTGQDTPGRVVFFSFPFDTLPESGSDPNNRTAVMRKVISFLAPGVNGLGTISLDNPSYPVPGLITVEVADSDLTGDGQTTATLTNVSSASGVTVTLNETVRPGLFRGFVTLIPTNAVAGPNQLRAKSGDTIIARYFDASPAGTVQVDAVVDTAAPEISDVGDEASYQDAIISWTTTEPSDSLVQFGESVLLGRVAYSPTLETDHVVILQGLQTDRDYYYKVVSRDEAGNTVVDDNNGQLHVFHTLDPEHLPWTDTLENSGTNWTVITADESELSWTLGVPDNSLETNAHSPTQAWGSNLKGEGGGAVESFLISPAIELSGGNHITLQFWHSYDFLQGEIEFGELLILTNSVSAPIPLKDYGEFSDSWELETINLNAYAGKVVYLVWHYFQFSLDNFPRPGWLVDDISITASNAPVGTVQVSNNIAQSIFVMTGQMTRRGKGLLTTITNAPSGQYVIQYGDVQWYQTPGAQTNSLIATNTMVFQGNYTFADANQNGMSDTWEQSFFGAVSTNRTQSTDTDADTMTDFGEFTAGTDPTNAASKLAFVLPLAQSGDVIQLKWSSVARRAYQVQSSTNAVNWTPLSGWLTASGANTFYSVTNSGGSRFYRVQVRP